jgi:hypothetical protein
LQTEFTADGSNYSALVMPMRSDEWRVTSDGLNKVFYIFFSYHVSRITYHVSRKKEV